jgi:hypothetical protein
MHLSMFVWRKISVIKLVPLGRASVYVAVEIDSGTAAICRDVRRYCA